MRTIQPAPVVRPLRRRLRRGQAMLVTLSIVAFMSAMVAASLLYAGHDQRNAAMEVHNTTVDRQADAALQYGRSFFTTNYSPQNWTTYLTFFTTPQTIASVQSAHPELVPSFGGVADAGYVCFTYIRNDMDGQPGTDGGAGVTQSATLDNNLKAWVGAYCDQYNAPLPPDGGTSPTAAELMAVMELNPAIQACQSQFAGGTQGVNNCAAVAAPRTNK